MPPTRRRRRPPREKGESFPTFLKVLVPLFIMGLAVFQSVSNNGHVDNNVIGALIFIALGGAVGYVADRFIQAWLGIGEPTTLPPDSTTPGEEPKPQLAPPQAPFPRRKRKQHHDA